MRFKEIIRPTGSGWPHEGPWAAAENVTLLLLRLAVGAFLIWGVWDNIVGADRMGEFVAFLHGHGFPYPAAAARLSVWAQFLVGAGLVLGLLTRLAGLVCAVHFAVALAMVDAQFGVRGAFPATILVLLGLHLLARGGGRFSLDRRLRRIGDTRIHN